MSAESKPESGPGDAQDADFGRAAKDKEERLDESLAQDGETPAEDDGAEENPRPGGKADPDQA